MTEVGCTVASATSVTQQCCDRSGPASCTSTYLLLIWQFLRLHSSEQPSEYSHPDFRCGMKISVFGHHIPKIGEHVDGLYISDFGTTFAEITVTGEIR